MNSGMFLNLRGLGRSGSLKDDTLVFLVFPKIGVPLSDPQIEWHPLHWTRGKKTPHTKTTKKPNNNLKNTQNPKKNPKPQKEEPKPPPPKDLQTL